MTLPSDDAHVTPAILAGGLAERMGGGVGGSRRGLLASLRESVRVEEIGPEKLAAYDPDGLMFVNVNTPHDYERAKDLMDRVRGSRAAMGDRITDAIT